MTRLPTKLLRQLLHRLRRAHLPVSDPRIDNARRVPQHPRRIAQCTAPPVGNDIGHLRGIVTTILFIDVLNDLFPTARLDIYIDIRWPIPFWRQKPLKQQPGTNGVNIGDPQRKTHHRVSGRTAPLRQNSRPATELTDVVHDEEVARETQLSNHSQLIL